MVRYYGLYSNAHRGKIRKAGVSPFHPPIIEGEYHVPSRGWAEMIRKVYEIDPLICPSCRGQMRIIAFIEDPKAIETFFDFLSFFGRYNAFFSFKDMSSKR
jgi:hypothetical protein